MRPEPSLDLVELLRWLDEHAARYLLIGRHAVRLYGSPVHTVDIELWLRPDERTRFLTWLDDRGVDLSDPPDGSRPLVRGVAGLDRVDAFFVRAMTNQAREELVFDDLLARSRVLVDEQDGVKVRIPDLPDLIALKKMRLPNRKDEEDLRYLEVHRVLETEGRLHEE